jgi:hypothetical protein
MLPVCFRFLFPALEVSGDTHRAAAMHTVLSEFLLSSAFRAARKKSEAELNFPEKTRLLREKSTIVAFLKYRLSSALLKTRSEIWCKSGT